VRRGRTYGYECVRSFESTHRFDRPPQNRAGVPTLDACSATAWPSRKAAKPQSQGMAPFTAAGSRYRSSWIARTAQQAAHLRGDELAMMTLAIADSLVE